MSRKIKRSDLVMRYAVLSITNKRNKKNASSNLLYISSFLSDSDLYCWSLAVRAAQKESTGNTLEFSGSRSGPYFDKGASKNVTALLGKTAYLNCRVKNLGNKTVSIDNKLSTFIYRLHKIRSRTYSRISF
jgi:hypothetical protein